MGLFWEALQIAWWDVFGILIGSSGKIVDIKASEVGYIYSVCTYILSACLSFGYVDLRFGQAS